MSTKINIGIDCRFWGVKHAGLGRYTRELVLEMVKNKSSQLNFTLFFQKGDWLDDQLQLKDQKIVEVDIPHYSLKEQLILGKIIDEQELSFVHFPHFNVPIILKTPFVVTIHDLIKHFFKGKPVTTRNLFVYWLKYGGYRLTIGNAVNKSLKIITPSYFAKDQVAVHYQGSDSKIKVIYEGVGSKFLVNDQLSKGISLKVLQKYKISKPFFIYTGSAYPSKNIETLLSSFKELLEKQNNFQLIIACARSFFWEKLEGDVKKMNLEKAVILPGSISDEDLRILYSQAEAFVMPSLMEGFGLPALEAMSVGCPIISSNAGSLPEIYEQGAIYFNPTDVVGLYSRMNEIIKYNGEQRQVLIDKGIKRSKVFSWEKAAKETLNIYEDVLERNYRKIK